MLHSESGFVAVEGGSKRPGNTMGTARQAGNLMHIYEIFTPGPCLS